MLPSRANVIIWDEMLSSWMKCECVTFSGKRKKGMLLSGANVIVWDEMLSSGMMFSSGMPCYHLELMLSSRAKLSSGTKCYHLR